jgi:hypothetical protein
VVCKSQEEIDSKLSNGFFTLHFVDMLFDPTDFETPYKYIFRKEYYTSISTKFFKTYSFYFKNVDYVTDAGFLLEDKSTQPFYQFDYNSEMIDLAPNPTLLFRGFIRTSPIRDIYERKYSKIPDVVAQMGGLIKGITFIVTILISFPLKTGYHEYVINSVFNNNIADKFKNPSAAASFSNTIKNPTQTAHSGVVFNNYANNNPNRDLLEDYVRKTIRHSLRKPKSSVLKTIGLALSRLCNRKRDMFFESGYKKINETTDICKVISLSHEMELIKHVMLDDEVLSLFNFTIKTHTSYDSIKDVPINEERITNLLTLENNNRSVQNLRKIIEERLL